MGRIFEKRKERMFARWAKTSKAFTKLGKEIAIAVKLGGPDPAGNPRLRMAIQTARSLNMPKDRIEQAIKRVVAKDAESLQEITYEGYGPHKVALIVETATDNTTRTVANIRSIFSRWGGSLAPAGALDYVFTRKGVFTIERPDQDLDEFQLELFDHGLEELFEEESGLVLYSSFTGYNELQKALEAKNVQISSAGLQRVPVTLKDVSADQQAEVEKLITAVEEDDDVQHVYHNMREPE